MQGFYVGDSDLAGAGHVPRRGTEHGDVVGDQTCLFAEATDRLVLRQFGLVLDPVVTEYR